MKKEKDYYYDVDVKWGGIIAAKSKAEAIKLIKESFLQEFNLELDDEEIKIKK